MSYLKFFIFLLMQQKIPWRIYQVSSMIYIIYELFAKRRTHYP